MIFKPLSTVAEVIRGVSFSKDDGETSPSEGRLPVIRAGSIQDSLLLDQGQIWVPKEKINEKQKIRRDDIVMCTSSGSSDLVGKCAKSETDFDGSFGAFCAGIRPNKQKVSASYLYHFLNSPKFKNWSSSSSGANIKNIRISELAEFEIPLPPLEEQKRIAAILDKADAIRRKRQQAIKLADEFLRAVFLDMFGDPVTNPKGWKIKPLKQLGRSITGSTPPSQLDNMWGSEIPFATPGDLDGLLKTTVRNLTNEGAKKSRSCRKGSLLACCIGATIGKVSLAGVETTFNQQINAQEWNNEINDDYGYFVFKLYPELIIKNAIKTTLPILKKSLFDEIELPVPDIKLQNDFSKIVNAAWSIKDKYQSHETDNLFVSLSQKAFS